mgnify:CR=1 FL=1
MSTSNRNLGRRDVLRLFVVGGAGLAVIACGGGGSAVDCSDTAGLAPADAELRRSQAYVDQSTRPDNCAACTFFTAGAAGACGTCTVIRGSINPGGYCNLFSRRPS